MITFDSHSLFAYAQVQSIVSQNASTIVVVLTTGSGANFSVGQQICFAPPSTMIPLKTNSMIGRITGISGDQITCDITSGNREGSSQFTVQPGWQFANPLTPKVLTDIEKVLNGTTGGATLLNSILNSPTISTPTVNIGSDAVGDLLYRGLSGALARLAAGTSGYVLQSNGAGQAPSWTPSSTIGILKTFAFDSTIVNASNSTSTDSIALSQAISLPLACDLLILTSLNWYNSANGGSNYGDIQLDGTIQGQNNSMQLDNDVPSKAAIATTFQIVSNVASGSHTITTQFRTNGTGSAAINNGVLGILAFQH